MKTLFLAKMVSRIHEDNFGLSKAVLHLKYQNIAFDEPKFAFESAPRKTTSNHQPATIKRKK